MDNEKLYEIMQGVIDSMDDYCSAHNLPIPIDIRLVGGVVYLDFVNSADLGEELATVKVEIT